MPPKSTKTKCCTTTVGDGAVVVEGNPRDSNDPVRIHDTPEGSSTKITPHRPTAPSRGSKTPKWKATTDRPKRRSQRATPVKRTSKHVDIQDPAEEPSLCRPLVGVAAVNEEFNFNDTYNSISFRVFDSTLRPTTEPSSSTPVRPAASMTVNSNSSPESPSKEGPTVPLLPFPNCSTSQLREMYALMDVDEDGVVSVADLFDFIGVHQHLIMGVTSVALSYFISKLERGAVNEEDSPYFAASHSTRTFFTLAEIENFVSLLVNASWFPYSLELDRGWWELGHRMDYPASPVLSESGSNFAYSKTKSDYSTTLDMKSESNINVMGEYTSTSSFLSFDKFCMIHQRTICCLERNEDYVYHYDEQVKEYLFRRVSHEELHSAPSTFQESPVSLLYERLSFMFRTISLFRILEWMSRHGITPALLRSGACSFALQVRGNQSALHGIGHRKKLSRQYTEERMGMGLVSWLAPLIGWCIQRDRTSIKQFYEKYCLTNHIVWSKEVLDGLQLLTMSSSESSEEERKRRSVVYSTEVERVLFHLLPYFSFARTQDMASDVHAVYRHTQVVIAAIYIILLLPLYWLSDYCFRVQDYTPLVLLMMLLVAGVLLTDSLVTLLFRSFTLRRLRVGKGFPVNPQTVQRFLSQVARHHRDTPGLLGSTHLEKGMTLWASVYSTQFLTRRDSTFAFLLFVEERADVIGQVRATQLVIILLQVCSVLSYHIRLGCLALILCFVYGLPHRSPVSAPILAWRLTLCFLAEKLAEEYLSVCFVPVRQKDIHTPLYHVSPLLLQELVKVKQVFDSFVPHPPSRRMYNPTDIFFERVCANVYTKAASFQPSEQVMDSDDGVTPTLTNALFFNFLPEVEKLCHSLEEIGMDYEQMASYPSSGLVKRTRNILCTYFPWTDFTSPYNEKAGLTPNQLGVLGLDGSLTRDYNGNIIQGVPMVFFTTLVKRQIAIFAMILSLLQLDCSEESGGNSAHPSYRRSEWISSLFSGWFMNSVAMETVEKVPPSNLGREAFERQQHERTELTVLQVKKMERLSRMLKNALLAEVNTGSSVVISALDMISVPKLLGMLNENS